MQGWFQIILFCAVLLAIVPLLGGYMARVFTYERASQPAGWKALRALADRVLRRVLVARALPDPAHADAASVQPGGFHSGTWDLTSTPTSSFVTNTNWQYYGGETTLSTSARWPGWRCRTSSRRRSASSSRSRSIRAHRAARGRLGNFWRGPDARAAAACCCRSRSSARCVLASQGVVQSLGRCPVASQEIIKVLGTNGGGFFNVNSAFPFENPNGLTNFLEMLAMLAIPASLTFTYGRMVGSRRQGWTIFGAMFALFAVSVVVDLRRRAPRHARPAGRRRRRRQPRGQGAALRHRRNVAVDGRSRPPPRPARSTRRSSR